MANKQQVAQQLIIILMELIPSYDASFWSIDSGLFGEVAEFDSMAIVTLIGEIEETFDVTLDDDDISAENFETIASLAQLVVERIG